LKIFLLETQSKSLYYSGRNFTLAMARVLIKKAKNPLLPQPQRPYILKNIWANWQERNGQES